MTEFEDKRVREVRHVCERVSTVLGSWAASKMAPSATLLHLIIIRSSSSIGCTTHEPALASFTVHFLHLFTASWQFSVSYLILVQDAAENLFLQAVQSMLYPGHNDSPESSMLRLFQLYSKPSQHMAHTPCYIFLRDVAVIWLCFGEDRTQHALVPGEHFIDSLSIIWFEAAPCP